MKGNNESKRGLYEKLRRVLIERGQELESLEVLLKFIYANYEDIFWKIILNQMSEPELEHSVLPSWQGIATEIVEKSREPWKSSTNSDSQR